MKTLLRPLILLPMIALLRAADPTPVTNVPLPPNVEVIKIPTPSSENREVPFYVRRPAGYDPANPATRGKVYRILFICPIFNGDGMNVITKHSLIPVADKNGWFIVSPTFKQDKSETKNRAKSYYYPSEFSGKAVLDALDVIARKYPVDINHLLLKGLSGGGQFVHRFALYAPERVTAIAVNSCSWFDDPTPQAAKFPWLVTIGESDPAFEASLEFVSKLKSCGALPIYKAYLGMLHESDSRVSKMDAAFLTFYDKLTAGNLGKPISLMDKQRTGMALTAKEMPFVGDSQDWRFWPNTAENQDKVSEDSRIYLPNDEIAKLWGQQEDE
jgi:pimeloyl-ACP methyl ester carboxylesterase